MLFTNIDLQKNLNIENNHYYLCKTNGYTRSGFIVAKYEDGEWYDNEFEDSIVFTIGNITKYITEIGPKLEK